MLNNQEIRSFFYVADTFGDLDIGRRPCHTGFMQFLTMCGLVGTAATMGLALILDLIPAPEGKYDLAGAIVYTIPSNDC